MQVLSFKRYNLLLLINAILCIGTTWERQANLLKVHESWSKCVPGRGVVCTSSSWSEICLYWNHLFLLYSVILFCYSLLSSLLLLYRGFVYMFVDVLLHTPLCFVSFGVWFVCIFHIFLLLCVVVKFFLIVVSFLLVFWVCPAHEFVFSLCILFALSVFSLIFCFYFFNTTVTSSCCFLFSFFPLGLFC